MKKLRRKWKQKLHSNLWIPLAMFLDSCFCWNFFARNQTLLKSRAGKMRRDRCITTPFSRTVSFCKHLSSAAETWPSDNLMMSHGVCCLMFFRTTSLKMQLNYLWSRSIASSPLAWQWLSPLRRQLLAWRLGREICGCNLVFDIVSAFGIVLWVI